MAANSCLFDGDQTTLVSSHLTTASTPFKFACHVPILKPYPLAAQRLAQLLEQDVQSWAAAMILNSHTHWDPPAFRIFAWLHPYDAIMINSITPAITGVHTHFPHLFFGPASPQCHKNIGDVRADTMDRRDGSPLLRAMSRHSDGYEWLPDPCTWLLPATRPVHGATTRYHKGDLPTGLPRSIPPIGDDTHPSQVRPPSRPIHSDYLASAMAAAIGPQSGDQFAVQRSMFYIVLAVYLLYNRYTALFSRLRTIDLQLVTDLR
ncbi:hypothetical protein GGX14DRAFT_407788 [Mycena pura]|uniref:Uncharacterized protein n=1 Tax=Mycena pura TaxID=153505 RepID=A0AAD6Y077_9AGAR|nr:hypothetical protein GGX14DRAFT_407788 [Mycena pura]